MVHFLGKHSSIINVTYFICNISRSTKDLAAMRCHEKQIVKLADLIKTALNEVGCEELPSGCDDISVDPSFIENNICNNDQQSVSMRYTAFKVFNSFHLILFVDHYWKHCQNIFQLNCSHTVISVCKVS